MPRAAAADPRVVFATLGLGAAMALLAGLHVPFVNGPAYAEWPWQRLSVLPSLPWFGAGAAAFFGAQVLHERAPASRAWGLTLLMLAAFAFQLGTIAMAGEGFDRIWKLVEDPIVTSYHADARLLLAKSPSLRTVLEAFPRLLPQLHLHSINKPPGLILYYMTLLNIFPAGHAAALAGGLLVGVGAVVAIPAVFFLMRTFGAGSAAAFLAASAMALCPGFILFFPEFDQVYAAVAAVMVATFVLALGRASRAWAAACGVVVSLGLFLTFSLLVLGVFFASAAIYLCGVRRQCSWWRAAESTAIVVAVTATVYGLLWLALDYDIIATFAASRRNEQLLSRMVVRPYPDTVLFDIWGFALGVGWMPAALLVARAFSDSGTGDGAEKAFVWMTLTQLLVLAALALLPAETTRLWIFMCPFALYATGLELRRWTTPYRSAFFSVAFVNLLVIGANMQFLTLSS